LLLLLVWPTRRLDSSAVSPSVLALTRIYSPRPLRLVSKTCTRAQSPSLPFLHLRYS
jgi:hypothetical protein